MWRFTFGAEPLGCLVADVGVYVAAAPVEDPLTVGGVPVKLHARDGASDPLRLGRIVGKAAQFPDPARVTLNLGLNKD